MADIEFENYSMEVKAALDENTIAWLYEAAGEVQSAVARNYDIADRVDTGQTKNSYQYQVLESDGEAQIGSNLENAIWEEFGTGIYALNGDGRKTPWGYKDRSGQFHWTHGKTGHRPLFKAFNDLQDKLKKSLENVLKGMN